MKYPIILKNPCLIHAITFGKNTTFKEENLENYLKELFQVSEIIGKSIKTNDNFHLKYSIISEIDSVTIEIWFMISDSEKELENTQLIETYQNKNIQIKNIEGIGEIFCEKKYIICSNFLDLCFTEVLLYDIYFKKLDEIRYIYSKSENNEFIVNFLKHIIKFDIYYAKILSFYKNFSISYPDIQKSNFSLIEDYSKVIEGDITNFKQDNLISLNKKINSLQALNFGLMYDIESLDSNLENLESRLKSIGGQESRYFLNHIEKAKFIIETFDSVIKKNNLIKENILDNYINFVKNNIEQQKLEHEKSKINHIKNIKEIIGSLAFIEIFINGLAETSKIFHFPKSIAIMLENTAFMRMSLILIFVVGYFIWFFTKKRKKGVVVP